MHYTPVPLDSLAPCGVAASDSLYTFPKGLGCLAAPMKDGALAGVPLAPTDWIAMDVTCTGKRSAIFSWYFHAADGRWSGVKMGVLAGVRTRIALPVSVTEGKRLFLPRTPGKLKSVSQGVPLDYREAVRFEVTSAEAPGDVTFRIESFGVYDGKPDFPVESRALVDEMGQKAFADWPGKTKSFDEMAARMRAVLAAPAPERADDGRSKWGGDLSLRLTRGTGFFTLQKWKDRWLLADPDGYAFFSTGLDCVSIGGDANLEGIRSLAGNPDPASAGWIGGESFSWHRHNLWRVFGDDYVAKWREMTARRMRKWGFNTVACWSDLDFAERYGIPHVAILEGYPETETYLFRDFPDTMSPEFAANAKTWARQMERHRGVASLIGYFLGNEPHWAFVDDLNVAACALECERPNWSRRALVEFLRREYGSIGALNAEWGADYASFEDMDRPVSVRGFSPAAMRALARFSEVMIREYIRVPSEAVRAVDPDHLNLGIRYAWLSSKELAAGAEFTDAFSFNCYAMDPVPAIDAFVKLVGKPVIIGEFHFGALDRGLDATGIRGVASQEERGAAYRRYMQRAAAHPMCIGAHYFTLNDQAYLGRFDGENYQIGIVDVTQRPYEEFESAVVETHRELYDVAEGKRPVDAREAREIPPIFF